MMILVDMFGLYLRRMAFVLLMKLNKGFASPQKKSLHALQAAASASAQF
jgi:hypothetical protein